MQGVAQAADHTPSLGPESVRNHLLRVTLPDGRLLEVELGYMGLWTTGILMLCISAGLAVWLNDEEWIKLRGTITGLIAASFFIIDGARGGPYIGKGLARYMPYSDIHVGRFAIVMGVIGLIMAALNYGAAKLLTTDNWLFYKTFVDNFIVIGLVLLAMRYSRTKPKV